MEKIKQNPFVKKVGFNRIVLCFVLLLMYAFFCALTQGSFFGIERILSTLNYAYFLGFLSLGVTFVIATGGIDFSIGPVMFCCALISGYCFTSHGMPMPVALILSIVIGLIFGIFNGYLVAYWSVPSFITSMASMNISKGVASVFTKTQSVSWPQEMQDGGWFRKIISIDGIPVGSDHLPRSGSCLCNPVEQNKTWTLHLMSWKQQRSSKTFRCKCKKMGNVSICYLWNSGWYFSNLLYSGIHNSSAGIW